MAYVTDSEFVEQTKGKEGTYSCLYPSWAPEKESRVLVAPLAPRLSLLLQKQARLVLSGQDGSGPPACLAKEGSWRRPQEQGSPHPGRCRPSVHTSTVTPAPPASPSPRPPSPDPTQQSCHGLLSRPVPNSGSGHRAEQGGSNAERRGSDPQGKGRTVGELQAQKTASQGGSRIPKHRAHATSK